jgi:hypothetical protein
MPETTTHHLDMKNSRSAVRRLLWAAVYAFGAATVMFLGFLWPLQAYLGANSFHLEGSVGAIVGPVLLEFAVVWMVVTLCLVRRTRHVQLRRCLWAVLFVVMLRQVVEYWYWTRPSWPPVPSRVDELFVVLLLLVLGCAVWLRQTSPAWLTPAARYAKTMLVFAAFNGAIILVAIGAKWWRARNLNTPRQLHHESASIATPRKRIVWLVLDELSYNQVYEHRFPGLALPAFDELAGQATVFTNVQPEGVNTEEVLPALISGVPTKAVRWPLQGAPLYQENENTDTWQAFDPANSVFQDALNEGYRTAVSGWYVPYCRIMSNVLDQCYWSNLSPVIPSVNLFSGHTFGWNAKVLASATMRTRLSELKLAPRPVLEDLQTDAHREVYQRIAARGDAMLNDPSLSFVMIHLPIPHPKGFYDRMTHNFSYRSNGYIDSLALCDVYLAHLMELLKKNGTWDDTTLVVMGDHSWRVGIFWLRDYLTSEEDVASSHEHYDPRPGYIVKLAGQSSPARIDAPFQTIRTRALFDAVMRGQIVTPEQLQAWAK